MEDRPSQNFYLIPGAIIVAGALIAGAVIYANSPKSVPPANRAAAVGNSLPSPQDLSDDDPALGNPAAPVTIVEFSDFQCPFCRRFFQDTLSKLKDKYIKTGQAKFVYRDFPLTGIHDMAQKYAEAGECADEEGKFWHMHDKIFEEQARMGIGTIGEFGVLDVKRWAREIGLNGAKFDFCLDSGKYAAEVQKDYNDGVAAGVSGTPGTFVNGRLVQGAVPYAQFEAVIEEELKKVK